MSNSSSGSLTALAKPLSICESASLEYYTSLILAGVLFFFLALKSPKKVHADPPPRSESGQVKEVERSPRKPEAMPDIRFDFDTSARALSGRVWEKHPWAKRCCETFFSCVSSFICSQIIALMLGYASLSANLVKAVICLDDTLFWGTVVFFVIYTLVFVRQRLSFGEGEIKHEIGCNDGDKCSRGCQKVGLCICCIECPCC